jgi:hypothetical protein
MKTYGGVQTYIWSLTSVLARSDQHHALTVLPTRRNSHRYPLNRSQDEPQSRPGCGGEQNNPNPCRESNSDHPSRSLDSILTELPALKDCTMLGAKYTKTMT